MTGEVIKEFLVGLGFGIDDASLAKFNKAISNASLKVAALATGIEAAAAGIFYGISKISQSFEDMGYEMRLVMPAYNKFLLLRQAMITAYSKAGVNLTKVIQQSILFNYSLAKTKFALEAIYKSVGARFLPLLTKQMDIFRSKIFANMPKIQDALEKFVNFIFKAFEATYQLGMRLYSILSRVYQFFVDLDQATGGWSTKIMAAIAIWKLLNLAFLATPLGMILSGFLALLALYDDFKTWEEGGRSLIDWGSDATKMVLGLGAGVGVLAAAFYGLSAAASVLEFVETALVAVLGVLDGELTIAAIAATVLEAPLWLIVAAIGAIIGALTVADSKWNIFGGHLSGFFTGVGGKILGLMSGAQSLSNMLGQPGAGAAVMGPMQPAPLLPGSSTTTAKISQENVTNVYGVPDAAGVARSQAQVNQQNNADLTRNTKGALR